MSGTKIPFILGRKRSRGSEELHKTDQASLRVLGDVTNTQSAIGDQRTTKMSKTADMNVRLMNRYYYGDPSVIEEVKKRERKAIKDIQHFRRSIAAIESETKLIIQQELPAIAYAISKRTVLQQELRKELLQLTTKLDVKTGECELMRKEAEMGTENLRLQLSVKLQEEQNIVNKKLHAEKLSWETKVRACENAKPDPEILSEIEQLNREKDVQDRTLDELKCHNEKRCTEFTRQLSQEFEKFIQQKEEPLQEIHQTHASLSNRAFQLRSKMEDMDKAIKERNLEEKQICDHINSIREKLQEQEARNRQLRQKLTESQKEHDLVSSATDEVQKRAQLSEAHYNIQFDKMESEQTRRRKLEYLIDNMRDKIRCFAYVDKDLLKNYNIDYSTKEISNEQDQAYRFSRIIPRGLVSEEDLLRSECQVFIENCLAKKSHCSFISLPNTSKDKFRDSFVKFMCEQKCISIQVQYVALSEKAPSTDMFSTHVNCLPDNAIEVRIEEEAVEMNSRVLNSSQISTQELPLNTIVSGELSEGIGILKMRVLQEQETFTDVYFVEINDFDTVKTLKTASELSEKANTPITIILQTLLLRTKPIVLFNMFDPDSERAIEGLLSFAGVLSKLETKRKSISHRKA
ncbi:LAMI_0C02124g1_1 [Lachancea mirantina]|uniref:LAMI_0C02124g1_1 n=1 Tax=Lachancea mirantina TaxID=1230905 RepID=A0A1G4J0U9_9SACH|nr:LAMI_0C02124g1_1 [Lachancea mirantina]